MTDARVVCPRCRRRAEWASLARVAELASAEVAPLVTRWPGDAAVDVRACPCGGTIARIVRRHAARDAGASSSG